MVVALIVAATFAITLGLTWRRMHLGETAYAVRAALGALGVRTRRRWYRIGLLGEGPFAGGRLRVERGLDDQRGRLFSRHRSDHEPEVVLRLSLDLPLGLRLRRADGLLPIRLLLGRPEPTGDVLFDRLWTAHGEADRVHALLGAEVRAAVQALHEPTLRVTDAELRVTLADAACSTGELIRVLRGLEALRTALLAAAAVPTAHRLEHHAEHDPEPEVRAACFTALAAVPANPRVAGALRRVAPGFLQSRAATVRLLAASHLGEGALDAWAQLCADPSTALEVRAEAWRRLAAAHPQPAALAPLFWRLWSSAQGALRAALLGEATRVGVSLSRAQLDAIVDDPDSEVQSRVATALGRTDAEATPVLLRLLSAVDPVAQAAASALGQVGDARAVAPLERVAQSILLTPALRQVAQVAARRIVRRLTEQARARGAGQLSLAPAEGGGLSVVDAGGLAVVDPGDLAVVDAAGLAVVDAAGRSEIAERGAPTAKASSPVGATDATEGDPEPRGSA
jgi:hypothetical protein